MLNLQAFGVLGMPMGNLSAKQAIKTAGCTHTVIQAQWSVLQPNGPGTALDATAVAAIKTEYSQATTAGLKVMLEIALHYAPAWVITGANSIEQFKDQSGNVFDAVGAGAASGQYVANWQWTALGRTYVSDFITKLGAALTPAQLTQTVDIKIGGGYYGELHYPLSTLSSAPYSWWGYGTSMQTGTGLSSDMVVCPVPGYTVFSGNTASDTAFINWYLNGLGVWIVWLIAQHRAAGFVGDFHVCHPGTGVRSNFTISQSGYQLSAALGEDPVRMMGFYAHDPKVWPYSTYVNPIDNYDGGSGPGADSDLSAWEKTNTEAIIRGKRHKLWGENTGGESPTQLTAFRTQTGVVAAPYSNPPNSYYGSPTGSLGFNGLFWLSYASLTDGNSSHVQLSDLASFISAFTPQE